MGIRSQTKESRHAKLKNVESHPQPRIQPVSRHPLLHLQQTAGNQILGQLIQAKLKISQPGDQFEQEADRVAEQVMRMPASLDGDSLPKPSAAAASLQRSCAKCEEEDEQKTIQRQAGNNADELEVQAKGAAGPSVKGPVPTPGQINSLGNGGEPLPESTRAFFEPRFGYEFNQVRVHTDSEAAESARAVNALAYTVGRDVVFGAGQYAPESGTGRQLLAHELAHVVQQNANSAGGISLLQRAEGTPPAALPAADGGLSHEMLAQIARQLEAAMSGPGTDESAIYAAMGGRTQEQINVIVRVYQEIFHQDLFAELRSELNDSEMLYLGSLAPTLDVGAPQTPADQTRRANVIAQQLYEAMDIIGTDESAIFAALSGRTDAERLAVKNAYKEIGHRHELEADLIEELEGSDRTRALRLLNQGVLLPEDELYLAMEGLGTDEDTIFRVLDAMSGDDTKIQSVEASYRSKYGDLVVDLRGDLSGSEYARAMRILRPALSDTAFEECDTAIINEVRALVPVGIQKVERAIAVLARGWDAMSADEQSKFNTYFDPHHDGFDSYFVGDVLNNFRKIRAEFNDDLTVECESDMTGICSAQQLYYTYWSNIHVCAPTFRSFTNVTQKQRDFVHELTHNALLAVDRPYYGRDRAAYDAMTPRGNWAAQLPVVGYIFRVAFRTDTLNAPDAYSYFAFSL